MTKRRSNGEGGLYQRHGRWSAQVSLQGRRLSKTFKSQREAVEWIRATHNQIDQGMTFASTKRTLAQQLTLWLENSKPVIRSRTWAHYGQLVQMYVVPHIGKIILKDLSAEHIQGLYTHLLKQGVGIATVTKIHGLLHNVLKVALEAGMLNRNPVDHVHPPKTEPHEMAVLDEGQASRLLVAAIGHPLEALLHLALATGARRNELLGLRWSDLDWVRQTLKIEVQLVRPDRGGLKFQSTKTRAGRRTIPLGDQTILLLRNQLERQQLLRLAAGKKWVENDLVFTNPRGRPIGLTYLHNEFHRLLEQAGLPPIRFHDLRHTAASLMLNHGVAPIIVSRRLGHSKTSVTLDVYGHLIPSMQEGIGQLMDDLVTPIQLQPIAAGMQPGFPGEPENPKITR